MLPMLSKPHTPTSAASAAGITMETQPVKIQYGCMSKVPSTSPFKGFSRNGFGERPTSGEGHKGSIMTSQSQSLCSSPAEEEEAGRGGGEEGGGRGW